MVRYGKKIPKINLIAVFGVISNFTHFINAFFTGVKQLEEIVPIPFPIDQI